MRYETRFKLLRERILAMKALWTQQEAAFHGEMVNFDPVWLYPKPAQRPHPPILLGGSSDYTLKRVVEFCDGWLPIARPGFNPKEAVARLRQAASAAGRDFSTLSISVFAARLGAWLRRYVDRRKTQSQRERNNVHVRHRVVAGFQDGLQPCDARTLGIAILMLAGITFAPRYLPASRLEPTAALLGE